MNDSPSTRQALLIVDMQHGLFEAQLPHDFSGVMRRINDLADRARAAGDPVILIQHEAPGSEVEHGSAGWQLDSRLRVSPGDIRIHKKTSAPYASSNLQQILDERSVGHVVVTGYSTEFCVDSTVRWSASLGFEVTLVADAHTTHAKPHLSAPLIVAHHNATLPAITSLGAPIGTALAASLWAVPESGGR